VHHEIRYRHLAGQDKGYWTRGSAHQDGAAAEEFQQSCRAAQAHEGDDAGLRAGWKTEQLHDPV